MRILAFVIPALFGAAISGCGVGGSATAGNPAGPYAATTREVAHHADVDLVVSALVATPRGPTTASTVILHATFANRGTACTPSGYRDGTLSYVPFRYTVSRDGEIIAGGEIAGLTDDDAVTRDITLVDQPPGDKTYVVTIDSTDAIGETNETNNQATVLVIFGGAG